MKKRLVITTMACAMLFAGCGVTLENKADNKTDSSVKTEVQENTKEENTEKENTKKENTKADSEKDEKNKNLVSVKYENKSDLFSYTLPQINIDSEDVKKINSEIESVYMPLIEDELEHGDFVNMFNVQYNYYVNDNILSVYVMDSWPNDEHNYDVYNVDINTGKKLDNKAIIDAKNTTESELMSKVKEKCVNNFIERNGDKETYTNNMKNSPNFLTDAEVEDLVKVYDKQFKKASSDESYSIDMPMFLNDKNNICVVATTYPLVFGEYYELIEITK